MNICAVITVCLLCGLPSYQELQTTVIPSNGCCIVSAYATSFDVIMITGKVQQGGREHVTGCIATDRTELPLLSVIGVIPHWGTDKFCFIPMSVS